MQQYTNSTPDIHDLVQIVNNGGIIAYPTDTVYGLGCNPYMPNSVEKIFKLKIRENKPLPLLCDSLESALKIASFDKISLKLAEKFWPGPLTILAPLKDYSLKSLTRGSEFIGLRIPNHNDSLLLISECGGYLVGTSANLSGYNSNHLASSVISQLPDLDAILINDIKDHPKESTIVKVENEEIIILRLGSIDSQLLQSIL